MSLSLREQLLKAGLATEKQARQLDQQSNRERRQQPKNKPAPQGAQSQAAREAQAAKAARDQALNRKRQEDAAAKARSAEVRQLIEQNRLPPVDGEEWFNFVDRGKVRRVAVNPELRGRLMRAELAIARCEGRYEIVTPAIAARIAERDAAAIVAMAVTTPPAEESSDYKDFPVPDDLMW